MEDLRSLLSTATREQRQPLVDIMDTKVCQSPSAEQIVLGLQWLHGSAISALYREALGQQVSYAEVLCTLLRKLDVACHPSAGSIALEEVLVRKCFEPLWARLKQPERGDLTEALEQTVARLDKTKEWVEVGGLAGLMIAGKLGGFGTYLLASTVIHGASSSVGLTLPFAFYKGVSSAISVALGPVGLAGLSIYAIYRLTGTNYEKLLPAALYISLLRYEIAARPNKVLGHQVIPHDYASRRGTRLF